MNNGRTGVLIQFMKMLLQDLSKDKQASEHYVESIKEMNPQRFKNPLTGEELAEDILHQIVTEDMESYVVLSCFYERAHHQIVRSIRSMESQKTLIEIDQEGCSNEV